ncbi:serine hydrolase [Paractinoplanes brasiliensis]|uniref:serine hydrolase n=1 Tax=Paractinoplanes brasiliensis TaxID=52695 RepID=UPI001941E09F|nr:serine hydrolase [Actinoplanes brasiliensis]GID32777.1 hypothetical protein Abr02nite_77600 [Actinoplanes brasiliensis]
MLLPRSAPASRGVSSRALEALLDRLEATSVECHSLMFVRGGHVLAEGWWAPYSATRPHLLYSLTKSFTSTAVATSSGCRGTATGVTAPSGRCASSSRRATWSSS